MSYVAGDTITLTLALVDSSGAAITTAVDGDFSETIRHYTPGGAETTPSVGAWSHVAGGLYKATISPAVEGTYQGVVRYDGTPDQSFAVSETVISAVQSDPLANLVAGYAAGTAGHRIARIGQGTTQVAVPVADGGDVRLYAGDDYAAADSRALSWAVALTEADLTGATVTLLLTVGAVTLTKTATVSNAGATTQTAAVTLTNAETDDFTDGGRIGRYDLSAVLASGRRVTLARGKVLIVVDGTA